jgi:hypothetical protein
MRFLRHIVRICHWRRHVQQTCRKLSFFETSAFLWAGPNGP